MMKKAILQGLYGDAEFSSAEVFVTAPTSMGDIPEQDGALSLRPISLDELREASERLEVIETPAAVVPEELITDNVPYPEPAPVCETCPEPAPVCEPAPECTAPVCETEPAPPEPVLDNPFLNPPEGMGKGYNPCGCTVDITPTNVELLNLLNLQVGLEIASANLYWVLSGVANNRGLFGTEKFFKDKYSEEIKHADGMFKFLLDKQWMVFIPEQPAIVTAPCSLEEFFMAALQHEKMITRKISDLYFLARETDAATCIFLEWYVREQVEEEAGVKSILDRIRLASGNSAALLQIDFELK
jgi:ferritin